MIMSIENKIKEIQKHEPNECGEHQTSGKDQIHLFLTQGLVLMNL